MRARTWRRRSRLAVLTGLLAGGALIAPSGGVAHASTVADPSGVPMPGNKPGWYVTFSDDFTGTAIDTSKWYTYSGHPSGEPDSEYSPTHVTEGGGMLVLRGYQDPAEGGEWTTGGISAGKALSQTFGKYEIRFRMDGGLGITYAALLWPANNVWPPEIDIAEDDSASRATVNGFQHFAKANGTNGQYVDRTSVDMTQWHTLGVEWTPDRITYTLDGAAWAVETNIYVPTVPMVLDLQTVAITCTGNNATQCISASTPAEVDMDVDWVVEYAAS
jgi:beta-glucanase (GH16 family)